MNLAGRVAVVTGAAAGIGRAVAEAFVKAGARVALNDLRLKEAETAAKAIDGTGLKCRALPGDVGEALHAKVLIDRTVEIFGRLDVLVNNAGIAHAAPFLDLAEADFDRVLRVNLKGPFLLTQHAARAMIAGGGGGAVVNVSSVAGVLADPDQAADAAAKGGLNQLTRAAAVALAPHGVRVNAVGPGAILTEMQRAAMDDAAARGRLLSRTPLGRLGTVEEIAQLVLFLASDAASYVTGQVVYADGGRLPLDLVMPPPEPQGAPPPG